MTAPAPQNRSNRKVAIYAAGFVGFMLALTFASAPLYDLFCRVTGFDGTTMRADAPPDPSDIRDRIITVRFDANVSPDLAWEFEPLVRSVDVRIGETGIVYFRVHNLSDKPVMGRVAHNVTPEKVGGHFLNIVCFCFTVRELAPGETADMPVNFFVDPSFADDPAMRDVSTITLSYTYFPAMDDAGGDLAAATQ